jgi:hypothetical protein
MQILFISALLLIAIFFLFGARRHSQASIALNSYLKQFGKLAENETVPVSVLEDLQAMFKDACHPCASLSITRSILRYRLDKEFRYSQNEMRPIELDGVDEAGLEQLSTTVVALFRYASYAIPGGFVTRKLLERMAEPVEKRKAKFLMMATYGTAHTGFIHGAAANTR